MFEDRRTIDDLITRYELEPDLKDFFVEGLFDKEVLSRRAKKILNNDFSFYEIDTVYIPPDILDKHGLTDGNKQRVIALSKELSRLAPEAKVMCLADKDLDHHFGSPKNTKRLKWTIYASIEGHYLSQEVIDDILITTGRSKITNTNAFKSSLEDVLKKLYALRLADRTLSLKMKWVALKKYLKTNKESIVFDDSKYIFSLLSSNAKIANKENFEDSYEKWLTKLNIDIRNCFRGHDYTELLAWSVDAFGGVKDFATQEAIERLFVLIANNIESLSLEIIEK